MDRLPDISRRFALALLVTAALLVGRTLVLEERMRELDHVAAITDAVGRQRALGARASRQLERLLRQRSRGVDATAERDSLRAALGAWQQNGTRVNALLEREAPGLAGQERRAIAARLAAVQLLEAAAAAPTLDAAWRLADSASAAVDRHRDLVDQLNAGIAAGADQAIGRARRLIVTLLPTALLLLGAFWWFVVRPAVSAARRTMGDLARANAALARLSTAIDAATEGIAVVDASHRIAYANAAFGTMHGIADPGALLGRSPTALAPDERDRFAPGGDIGARLAAEGSWSGELTARRSTGTPFPVDLSVRALADGTTLLVARDATTRVALAMEQRAYEHMLAEQNEELATQQEELVTQREELAAALDRANALQAYVRAVLDMVPSAIFGKDAAGRFTLANAEMGRAFGTTPAALIGRTNADFIGDGAAYFDAQDRHVLETGVSLFMPEEPLAGPDGVTRWFMTTKQRMVDPTTGAPHVVGVGTEITALRLAREEAERANRAKSDFLARMSHELRTPLTSVIGFSVFLERQLADRDGVTELERGYLGRIARSGRHLLGLINDILDLSKIEAGHVEVSVEPTDLVTMARDVVAQLEGQARPGVRLALDVPAGEVPLAMTDDVKLRQVLLNLVGNALKFTERGTVTLALVRDAHAPAIRAIEVRDTGIGIPRDRQAAVFEAFEQADVSTTRRFGGTGLGLSISRTLCHLLQADLVLESEPGAGSTFRIQFRGAPDRAA